MSTSYRIAVLAFASALAIRDDGCLAFSHKTMTEHHHRRSSSSSSSSPVLLYASSSSPSIGIFFGTSTGSTEEVAHLISAEFGDDSSEPIEIDGLKGSVAAAFAKYDSLIVGTPTWNTGADMERSGTGWDEIYYSEMQAINLAGKKVAVFGLGDSVSYAENYADASGELHDVFQGLGCDMIGYTSQEGYQHKSSKAIRGEMFCGLLLDAVNEEELTEGRVKNWATRLRDEGILETAKIGGASVAVAVPAPAAFASASPTIDVAASSVFEDNALAEEILREVKSTRSGYMAHYNPRTDKTMWINTDGRSYYVTAGSPGYE